MGGVRNMATNEVQPVGTKIVLEAKQKGQEVETTVEIKGSNHQAIFATLNLIEEMMKIQMNEKEKRELAGNIGIVINRNLSGEEE